MNEYNGMKIEDIILTRYDGYFRLTKIEQRPGEEVYFHFEQIMTDAFEPPDDTHCLCRAYNCVLVDKRRLQEIKDDLLKKIRGIEELETLLPLDRREPV